MHDLLRFLYHLMFRYPQRRLCDCRCEVVYLDTVELSDADLNYISRVEHDLSVEKALQSLVFELTERQECFREEVTGAAGRVKECQTCELVRELTDIMTIPTINYRTQLIVGII